MVRAVLLLTIKVDDVMTREWIGKETNNQIIIDYEIPTRQNVSLLNH